MSITSYALGSAAKAGYKTHTTDWNTGTGVVVGALDGFELHPAATPKTSNVFSDNLALPGGAAVQYERLKRQESVEGPFTINNGFALGQRLIASWWGAEGAPAAVGTGGYSHLLTIDKDLSGVYGNLAWSNNLKLHDINVCKVETLTFNYTENAHGTIEVGIVGKQEVVDDSGTNDLSTFDGALTLPTTQPAIKYVVLSAAQTTLRFNEQSGGALGAGDTVYPNNITLSFARSMTRRFTSRNLPLMDEPIGTDWIAIGGSFTLPLWDEGAADTWDNVVTGVNMKMDLAFVGTALGASAYTQKFEWPSISFDTDGLPDLNTPNLLEITFPFVAKKASAAPTGMAFQLPQMTMIDELNGYHLSNVSS